MFEPEADDLATTAMIEALGLSRISLTRTVRESY
jgi:hypothetical protein